MATATTEKFSITLSDGSVHEVEGKDLKTATAKLLKRKAIKDAGLTVVETPAEPEAPEAQPEPTPERNLIGDLPSIIAAYFAAEASTDPAAPMHGAPFQTAGNLYLQLEGRGGAGKGDDEFTPTGLRPFIARTEGENTPGKMAIQKALIVLGFQRKPFSYNHPERGSSSASYYSRPALGFDAVEGVEERVAAPRGKKSSGGSSTTQSVSADPIIPQRPEGSDEDVAKLTELENAKLDAQNALKAKRAEFGKKPLKKDDAEGKAKRDAELEELTGAMNTAHEALLDWRRTMHAKNTAASTTETTEAAAA